MGAISARINDSSTAQTTPSELATDNMSGNVSSRKPPSQPWIKKDSLNIILIGETGTGKTALLNLLANVCAGVELQNFHYRHLPSNEQGGSSSVSQTIRAKLYKIEDPISGHTIKILDTPGLADTRGIDMDNQHKESIANAITQDMEVIDGVIIMANGTVARLGVATEYVLNIISGMFPHSIIDNIGIIFTMVSSRAGSNFKRSSLPPELRKAQSWFINNPFPQSLKLREKEEEKIRKRAHMPPGGYDNVPDEDDDMDDDDNNEMLKKRIREDYDNALNSLNNLFTWLNDRQVQPTTEIYTLYKMSTEIEASISNVIARLNQAEKRQLELKALTNDKDAQEQIKTLNEGYRKIANKAFFEQQDTGDIHNTFCAAAGCYSNCHEGCRTRYVLKKETLGHYCKAFRKPGVSRPYWFVAWFRGKNGLKVPCHICKHLAEDHQHHTSKWVKGIREDKPAEERYKNAKTEAERISVRISEVREEMKGIEGEIRQLESELTTLCGKYDDLALSGSFAGHIASAIHLLRLREQIMIKDGMSPEALGRMAERIKRLENKQRVIEKAQSSKWKKGYDRVKGTIANVWVVQ